MPSLGDQSGTGKLPLIGDHHLPGEIGELLPRVVETRAAQAGSLEVPLGRTYHVKGIERHPIIEDDVVIDSGATILGRVRIGAGSIIGGNVWMTRSVPPGSRISQARPSVEAFENGAGI